MKTFSQASGPYGCALRFQWPGLGFLVFNETINVSNAVTPRFLTCLGEVLLERVTTFSPCPCDHGCPTSPKRRPYAQEYVARSGRPLLTASTNRACRSSSFQTTDLEDG